jgi:hypothetical protein
MRDWFTRQWKHGNEIDPADGDPALARSCAGRLISALTFIVVVFCLGCWITAFLLFRDGLFNAHVQGPVLTNLTCLTFFGGLIAAFFIGTMAGNYLRRSFWKALVRRRK